MRARQYTYLVTTVTAGRRRIFQRTSNAELMVETLFRYRDHGRFLLHGYVVMPEHFHVLLTPTEDLSLERCVQFIKGGFSQAVRSSFPGEVWQRGFNERARGMRGRIVNLFDTSSRTHRRDNIPTIIERARNVWTPCRNTSGVKAPFSAQRKCTG